MDSFYSTTVWPCDSVTFVRQDFRVTLWQNVVSQTSMRHRHPCDSMLWYEHTETQNTQKHTETHWNTQKHTERHEKTQNTQKHTEKHKNTCKHTKHTKTHGSKQKHTETHKNSWTHTQHMETHNTQKHMETAYQGGITQYLLHHRHLPNFGHFLVPCVPLGD